MPNHHPHTAASRPMATEQRILLATSSTKLHDTLAEQLTADGHDLRHARTRDHASVLLAGEPFELVLLADFEQPTDALGLLRDVRADRLSGYARPDLPVITFGASGPAAELHALRAYEAGSDHHLSASDSYLLLRATINAVLRRTATAAAVRQRLGSLEINPDTREVRVHDRLVELTAMEFRLLTTLAAHPTRVFSKDELMRDVWGYKSPGATRTLDSHACRLRRKLADHGHQAVHNIWGVGYRLRDPS